MIAANGRPRPLRERRGEIKKEKKTSKPFFDVSDHHSIKQKSAVNLLATEDYRTWLKGDKRRMTDLRKHELLDVESSNDPSLQLWNDFHKESVMSLLPKRMAFPHNKKNLYSGNNIHGSMRGNQEEEGESSDSLMCETK